MFRSTLKSSGKLHVKWKITTGQSYSIHFGAKRADIDTLSKYSLALTLTSTLGSCNYGSLWHDKPQQFQTYSRVYRIPGN